MTFPLDVNGFYRFTVECSKCERKYNPEDGIECAICLILHCDSCVGDVEKVDVAELGIDPEYETICKECEE